MKWLSFLLGLFVGVVITAGLVVLVVVIMTSETRECELADPCAESIRDLAAAGKLLEFENRIRTIGGSEALDVRTRSLGEPPARCRMLALSGGGLYGAFGAGVLNGWWEAGRPKFDVVTGISTGSLQAPLVFLHTEEATKTLEEVYANVGAEDIVEKRSLPGVLFADSLVTTEGLEGLIQRHVTKELIDKIADEAAQGRMLLVGTANLDTGQMEIWDMGEIAAAGDYDLFRKVLLASCAIPVSLPPVEIDGHLHADGGAREQIFLPRLVDALHEGHRERLTRTRGASDQSEEPMPPKAYFIVNGEIGLYPHSTQHGILDIAVRAIDLVTDEARVGNLWKCWGGMPSGDGEESPESKECFNLIAMPRCLLGGPKSSIELTREDSQKIYQAGMEQGRKANEKDAWKHGPADLVPVVKRP